MVPCTPLGCLMLLRDLHGSLAGMNAVCRGPVEHRGQADGAAFAGRQLHGDDCPFADQGSGGCAVARTILSRSGAARDDRRDLRQAGGDGDRRGINRIERDGKVKLVGDVAYASAAEVAGAITRRAGAA